MATTQDYINSIKNDLATIKTNLNTNLGMNIPEDANFSDIATTTGTFVPSPNLQSKTIEITENGDVEVTPDSGYQGLSKVDITTNVSGGEEIPVLFDITTAVTGYAYSSLQCHISKIPRAFLKQLFDNMPTTTTSNVGDYLLSGLTFYNGELDIRDMNVETITGYSNMFNSLGAKTTNNNNSILFPNNFGKKASSMASMFAIAQLNSLDLSKFNTSLVTNMSYMFNSLNGYSERYIDLDLSSFDTSKCYYMNSMFLSTNTSSKTKIHNLILPNNFGSLATTFVNMFQGCKVTGTIDFTKINPQNATSIATMFSNFEYPDEINITTWNLSKITSMQDVFKNTQATKITFGGNASAVTSMNTMFAGVKTKIIDLSNLIITKPINMSGMFSTGGSYLTIMETLIVPNDFGSTATSMSSMFSYHCYDFDTVNKRLDLSKFNTSNVTNMSSMFSQARYLAVLDISNFDFTKVTSFGQMFSNCGSKARVEDGAYAQGIPYVYVKDETAQNWILTKSNGRPTTWSTDNVLIK